MARDHVKIKLKDGAVPYCTFVSRRISSSLLPKVNKNANPFGKRRCYIEIYRTNGLEFSSCTCIKKKQTQKPEKQRH